MDIEQLKSCRENLLKEAARLSKIINDNCTYRMGLDDMLTLYQCEVINKDIVDSTHLMSILKNDDKPSHGRSIGLMLKSCGYRQITSRKIKLNGNYHYVWINPTTITDHQATSRVRQYHKEKAPRKGL